VCFAELGSGRKNACCIYLPPSFFKQGKNRMLNIKALISKERCYKVLRWKRWPSGVCCPRCQGRDVKKRGLDDRRVGRQRYHCHECDRDFDDVTGTIFEGRHQPVQVWILCLYFMGLNLSNQQIARELELNSSVVQKMATQLREGIKVRAAQPNLSGEVEMDEVYVVAG
jgi:transposase-like protein